MNYKAVNFLRGKVCDHRHIDVDLNYSQAVQTDDGKVFYVRSKDTLIVDKQDLKMISSIGAEVIFEATHNIITKVIKVSPSTNYCCECNRFVKVYESAREWEELKYNLKAQVDSHTFSVHHESAFLRGKAYLHEDLYQVENNYRLFETCAEFLSETFHCHECSAIFHFVECGYSRSYAKMIYLKSPYINSEE